MTDAHLPDDKRVFVCSNGDCRTIYGEDPQTCPLCKRKGQTWTTYPCPVECAACGGTKQALARVQYVNRACADELRPCPLCADGPGEEDGPWAKGWKERSGG